MKRSGKLWLIWHLFVNQLNKTSIKGKVFNHLLYLSKLSL